MRVSVNMGVSMSVSVHISVRVSVNMGVSMSVSVHVSVRVSIRVALEWCATHPGVSQLLVRHVQAAAHSTQDEGHE